MRTGVYKHFAPNGARTRKEEVVKGWEGKISLVAEQWAAQYRKNNLAIKRGCLFRQPLSYSQLLFDLTIRRSAKVKADGCVRQVGVVVLRVHELFLVVVILVTDIPIDPVR